MTKVAVIGLGYVGLPLAVRAAEVGHQVMGVDMDTYKIEALRSGTSYVEDVTDERLQAVLGARSFHAQRGLGRGSSRFNFDIAIIAVPTPLQHGDPDLSFVENAGRMIGRVMKKGDTVILESTTYPGTTEGLLLNALQVESADLVAGEDFHLGFSPERIDPGSMQYTLENTPKLVSGIDDESLRIIKDFYDTIVDVTVPVSSPRVAETAKLFENIQACVMIALANEMATHCHDLGINFWEVLDAAMTKGHSISRWTPGPGVGGHCLPIDPMYLAWLTRTQLGKPFRFAELANEINRERPHIVAQRAGEIIDLRGAEVLVLGVAYKPNVSDMRESPAIDVVTALRNGGAVVTVCDPHVTNWSMTPTLSIEELAGRLSEFPLSVIVTDHSVFDYDKIVKEAPLVLDCRNVTRKAENVIAL
jgi:UDP-N-acetyl-D-glucosamine dehydrogenase